MKSGACAKECARDVAGIVEANQNNRCDKPATPGGCQRAAKGGRPLTFFWSLLGTFSRFRSLFGNLSLFGLPFCLSPFCLTPFAAQ